MTLRPVLLILALLTVPAVAQAPTRMTHAQTIGRFIVGWRAAIGSSGISRDSLAKLIPMPASRLGRIERGELAVNDSVLGVIARAIRAGFLARVDSGALRRTQVLILSMDRP